MDAKTQARYELRAGIIKALAHPARLLMVDKLGGAGEMCVCELTELVGSDMSTVSKHLTILKQAGIVETEKRGSMVFYRLRVKCVLDFLECAEGIVKEGLGRSQKLLFCKG